MDTYEEDDVTNQLWKKLYIQQSEITLEYRSLYLEMKTKYLALKEMMERLEDEVKS